MLNLRMGRRAAGRRGSRLSAPGFRPGLEALEDRALLSGNPYPNIVRPAFVYDAQTLEAMILGTDASDNFSVGANSSGNIIVTHGGQALAPIDPLGQTLPPELHPTLRDTADITALLFDGDDLFDVDNRNSGLGLVPINLFGHEGSDGFGVLHPSGGERRTIKFQHSVHGGQDRDRLHLVTGSSDEFVTIKGVPGQQIPDPEIRVIDKATNVLTDVVSFLEVEEATIETGAGADQVLMDNTTGLLSGIDWHISTQLGDDRFQFLGAAAAVSLDTGSGDDWAAFDVFLPPNLGKVVANINIDLGNGADVLGFNLTAAAEAMDLGVHIQGGNGADTLSARVNVDAKTQGKLAVALEGNNGDDDLELAVFGGAALDELFALLDGGEGFDTGLATNNILHKDVEQFTPIGQ